jgi:hypothetical protein
MTGEGGMGSVWVATNTALDAPVAIKLIRREAQGVGAAERLLREARAAAQLRHPAIVRVFDFGETHRHDPYIVMELLDGESLRDLLSRTGRLLPEQALRMLLPIMEGLAIAHERGVVHRDLKPENVFLAQDDTGRMQPKLVDFGVAKVVHAPGSAALTGVGVIGTPEYMAPEQAMAIDVDHRADIWGICVLLHELMTDAYVFSGATAEATMRAVVDDEPRSLVEVAAVDPRLWDIISRGLRKKREERWASMRDLARAVATWLLEQGVDEDVCGASLRSGYCVDDPRWYRGRLASDPPKLGAAVVDGGGEPRLIGVEVPLTPQRTVKRASDAPTGVRRTPASALLLESEPEDSEAVIVPCSALSATQDRHAPREETRPALPKGAYKTGHDRDTRFAEFVSMCASRFRRVRAAAAVSMTTASRRAVDDARALREERRRRAVTRDRHDIERRHVRLALVLLTVPLLGMGLWPNDDHVSPSAAATARPAPDTVGPVPLSAMGQAASTAPDVLGRPSPPRGRADFGGWLEPLRLTAGATPSAPVDAAASAAPRPSATARPAVPKKRAKPAEEVDFGF